MLCPSSFSSRLLLLWWILVVNNCLIFGYPSCAIGLLSFRILGGRFWAVAPSSYTHLGSYARRSLPATENYATRLQRRQLERLGRRWGCHTCGSKGGWRLPPQNVCNFVGDHMPPKSVAAQMNKVWWRRLLLCSSRPVQYRFYPQCVSCSSKQGSLLSAATSRNVRNLAGVGGGQQSYFHGWQPRLYHGTGMALGVAAAVDPQLHQFDRWSRKQWKRVRKQLHL